MEPRTGGDMSPKDLNDHYRELYEERAAIKTWDAHMPKEQAEAEAFREVLELMAANRKGNG